MCDDIAVLEKERDKLVEQIARLNAEIEVAEGKRAILRYRTAELNGEIEEAQEDEAQIASEEADAFVELLKSDDASTLRIQYRQLSDVIDKCRKPGRECTAQDARAQRRAVVARLKMLEQKEVTR
jgi:chromosome segregation ATPase